MSNPSELFSKQNLLQTFIFPNMFLYLIPVCVTAAIVLNNPIVLMFAGLGVFAILRDVVYFYWCKGKHETSLAQHGQTYLEKLNLELKAIGFEGLVKRYWLGFEKL